jgi:hypothetical protein
MQSPRNVPRRIIAKKGDCTMLDKVRTRLKDAMATGEVLTIVYQGGSQPGSKRLIVPIQLSATDCRAREANTGMVKQFKVDKIVLVADGLDAEAVSAVWKDPNPPPRAPDPSSVTEAIHPHVAELEALGWRVELSDECAALFHAPRIAKTGRVYKPRPGPLLEYREFTSSGLYLDLETGEAREDTHKSAMPYVIDGRAFAHLGKAALRFMTLARELAPTKP